MHGIVYWSFKCEVCMRFGGTELEAYLEWKENVSDFGVRLGSYEILMWLKLPGGCTNRASIRCPRRPR